MLVSRLVTEVARMRSIHLFVMLSLDGYFEGPNHDLSWHNVDDEFNKFAIEQLRETGLILFGRKTYQLMESYWPKAAVDPETSPDDREIAHMMNNAEKIVFSRTLDGVHETENWKNVKLRRKVDPVEIRRLKEMPGKDIWVGTSDLAVSFIKEDLIDEFRFMINPVIAGAGTRIFQGLDRRLNLEMTRARSFKSGNTLLYYVPRRKMAV
jgi:dihydrofolate reductase